MEENIKINGLTSLLKRVVGTGFQIKQIHIIPFKSDSSNFSSILYEVTVSAQNISESQTRTFKIMGKILPDNQTQIIVNAKLGFQKEIHFYSILIPEYIALQQNAGILREDMLNIFPLYYGANFNLENNDDVILIGDVREEGFQISSLRNGLDHMHASIVLKELGKFHAIGVALKINQPEIFYTKLKTAAQPCLQNADNTEKNAINLQFRNHLKSIILTIPECIKYADNVNAIIEKIDNKPLPDTKEPFATLLHNDLWMHNILFQYHIDEPIAVKFVDFQTTIYNSPVRDIIYFIFTSTAVDVQEQFDHLIELYFKSFLGYLEKLVNDISAFTFDKFQDEIKFYSTTKIKHTILLFRSICGGDYKSEDFNMPLFKLKLRNLICRFAEMSWI